MKDRRKLIIIIALIAAILLFVVIYVLTNSRDNEPSTPNEPGVTTPTTPTNNQNEPAGSSSNTDDVLNAYARAGHVDLTDINGNPEYTIEFEEKINSRYTFAQISTQTFITAYVIIDTAKKTDQAIIAGPTDQFDNRDMIKMPQPVYNYISVKFNADH